MYAADMMQRQMYTNTHTHTHMQIIFGNSRKAQMSNHKFLAIQPKN